MSNFKVGDKVIVKSTKKIGTIVRKIDENWIVDRFDVLIDGREVTYTDIELLAYPKGAGYINLDMLECTCGLKYVRDGGNHSEWCDMAPEKIKRNRNDGLTDW